MLGLDRRICLGPTQKNILKHIEKCSKHLHTVKLPKHPKKHQSFSVANIESSSNKSPGFPFQTSYHCHLKKKAERDGFPTSSGASYIFSTLNSYSILLQKHG